MALCSSAFGETPSYNVSNYVHGGWIERRLPPRRWKEVRKPRSLDLPDADATYNTDCTKNVVITRGKNDIY